ncbi:hypothetical protein [uncultured Butyricimonas sp.]|uniref:hypothetical protein n=1 Tax=uncultured Butyricimonas sp. TaxID=1268785 RepID=UPI0026DBBDA2|nr:hypothetical protein [uncultured Butyricimonas sp.]
MKNILWLFLGCCLLASCWDEGELAPTQEPELIYGKYTLPQGNHDYDDDIVKFYRQYSSLILYKFTSKDFGWSPTSNVAWDITRDTVYDEYTQGLKWNAVPADEQYVGEQLELLNEKFLNYLSDTFFYLLPQKILLCSVIERLPTHLGYDPTPDERAPFNVYVGYYHLAVSCGNSKILTMTAEERNQFKIDVCTAYFETILNVLEKPQDFFLISTYMDGIAEDAIYENGFLEHSSRTSPNEDWFDYIKLAIGNSIEELEAEGGVLNESIDVNGKIREKYTIMTEFFKSKYHFDIQAIGNDVER